MTNPRTLFGEHIKHIASDAQNILSLQKYDSMVLFSGEVGFYHSDDIETPFRPAAHFSRFSTTRRANRCVIISKENDTPIFISYTPDDFWLDHSEQGDDFWKEYFEIIETQTPEDWKKEVQLRTGKKTAYIGPESTGLWKANWNPEKVIEGLDQSRTVKTPFEIACLNNANYEAAKGHLRIRDAFFSGASEREMYWEYLKSLNATEHDMPYPPIIAINEKGSVLHYEHRRDVQGGHSCLVDAGMMHLGYDSDISRTYAHESAHSVFKSLIDALDKLQLETVSKVTVGADMQELNREAHVGIANILNEHNIITSDPKEAVLNKITQHFLPHSLGHHLGLQTHDVGSGKAKAVLQEGYVTTIEPGIYFNPLLLNALKKKEGESVVNWNLVEELVPFGGIRIEDNIHVTKEGPHNLTRSAFERLAT